jgi:threonine dehydratase
MASIRPVRVPTLDDIAAAAPIVAEYLPPSPLDLGQSAIHPDLALKLESLQPTGSFKVRGALASLSMIDPAQPVVTASAGNHALGIAYAATVLARRATVVTSTVASAVKVGAIKQFDVELVQVGTTYDEAERHALEVAASGAEYVSPYNDPWVIAGQATIGSEIGQQLSGPLTIVCGIGGGGMASGIGLWASTRDDVRVIGVEVETSMAISAAVTAGRQVDVEIGETIADGMGGNIEPGSVTIPLVARYVEQLVTVSEAEVWTALRYLAYERGVVVEGSGAAPVAAVLAGKVPDDRPVVAVVSGRNISPAVLNRVLQTQDSVE